MVSTGGLEGNLVKRQVGSGGSVCDGSGGAGSMCDGGVSGGSGSGGGGCVVYNCGGSGGSFSFPAKRF
jgi:hypothetical protein